MDIAMNFTLGLSQGVAWPWPIAVYLFLAGISGGAVAVTLLLNLYRKQTAVNTPLLKAASLTGLVTILLGMVCLVLDLTNPLVFWRSLIYYNLTSVMSIGVIALLFYIPLVFVLTLVAFRKEIKDCGALAWLDGIVGVFDSMRCFALDRFDPRGHDLCLHGLLDLRPRPFPAHQHGCVAGALRGVWSLRWCCRCQDHGCWLLR